MQARLGGSVVIRCADTLLKSVFEQASDLLEAAITDIEYPDTKFVVAGAVYHGARGQQLSGSLVDYSLPRADEWLRFITEPNEVTEKYNRVGATRAGEGPISVAPAT